MSDWFRDQVLGGSMVLAIPVALVVGLLSFVSPCTLPMLPGYLSYATGLSGTDLATGNVRRSRMLAGALLFVLGFSVVFVGLGLAVGGIAEKLVSWQHTATIVLGVVSIVMGLAFLGLVPWLQRDVRVHKIPAVGLAAAPVLGFLFGLGWTPCNGPTLGAISALAWNQGTAGRGGLLLACYALGLGIPFVLVAVAWRKALVAIRWLRAHQQWVTRVGGALMVFVGLALVSGWWTWLVQQLQYDIVQKWGGISV